MSEVIQIGWGNKPTKIDELKSGEGVYSIPGRGVQKYIVGHSDGKSLEIYSMVTINLLPPDRLYIPSDRVEVVRKLKILAEFVFKSYVEGQHYAAELWERSDMFARQAQLPVFIEDSSRHGWTEIYMSRHHENAVFLGENSRKNKTWIYRP